MEGELPPLPYSIFYFSIFYSLVPLTSGRARQRKQCAS